MLWCEGGVKGWLVWEARGRRRGGERTAGMSSGKQKGLHGAGGRARNSGTQCV